MNAKVYLLNSFYGDPKVLNVPTKNGYKRAFDDISMLDLACIDLGQEYDEFDDVVRQCNPGTNMNGNYYVILNKENEKFHKQYAPFIVDSKEAQEVVSKFRYFAEQRANNIIEFNRKGLAEDAALERYIKYLLEKIYEFSPEELDYVFRSDSLLSPKFKEVLYLRTTSFYNKFFHEFYNEYSYTIKSFLSGYYELRALTIMYIQLLSRRKCMTKSDLYRCKNYDINGLGDMESSQIEAEISNLALKEAESIRKELRKLQTEEEAKRKAEEQKRIEEENSQYEQMDLSQFLTGVPKPMVRTKRGSVKDLLDY